MRSADPGSPPAPYCSKRCCDNATRTKGQSRAFIPIKDSDELIARMRAAEPEAFALMAGRG